MATKKNLTIKVLKTKKDDKELSVALDSQVFAQKADKSTLAQVLRAYIYNSHQQTKKVKTRGEVDLTKAKAYRQKGTGNARHGAKSAPIYVGGGVAHGPKGHITRLRLPKKIRNQALKSLLSSKLVEEKLFLLSLKKLEKPKTSLISSILKLNNLDNQKLNLVINKKDQDENSNLLISARNIKNLKIISSASLNPHHLSRSSIFIITKNSLDSITKRLIAK
jgi:large subunit ribosomal protein L4